MKRVNGWASRLGLAVALGMMLCAHARVEAFPTVAELIAAAKARAESCANITPKPPCGPCQPHDTGGDSSDGSAGTGAAGTNSGGLSIVDNMTYAYMHWADDYPQYSPPSGSSCCGGSQGPDDAQLTLSLRRVHCDRYASFMSSFGPGVFSVYDTKLYFYSDGGTNIIDVFDPRSFHVARYVDGPFEGAEHPSDTKDGVYYSYRSNSAKEIRLLDANDQLVTDPANAAKAVLTL